MNCVPASAAGRDTPLLVGLDLGHQILDVVREEAVSTDGWVKTRRSSRI
jgi:hypothetical protein